jgi:hypothetical protein
MQIAEHLFFCRLRFAIGIVLRVSPAKAQDIVRVRIIQPADIIYAADFGYVHHRFAP